MFDCDYRCFGKWKKYLGEENFVSIISKVNAILEDVKNKTETDNKNKEKNMPKDHNHKAWKE